MNTLEQQILATMDRLTQKGYLLTPVAVVREVSREYSIGEYEIEEEIRKMNTKGRIRWSYEYVNGRLAQVFRRMG